MNMQSVNPRFYLTFSGKKVLNLEEVTVSTNDDCHLLPEEQQVPVNYSWSAKVDLKLSRRKSRKLLYTLKRLAVCSIRKYYSKREKIKIIHDLSNEKGLGYIMDSDEVLMRYSSKRLFALITNLAYLSERSSI